LFFHKSWHSKNVVCFHFAILHNWIFIISAYFLIGIIYLYLVAHSKVTSISKCDWTWQGRIDRCRFWSTQ
jgi:hypothetical protein